MQSLAAYASDSDEELPIASSSRSVSLAVPAPTRVASSISIAAAKRKADSRGRLQVRVSAANGDNLDADGIASTESPNESDLKKPKLASGAIFRHSLLGALPTPKRAVRDDGSVNSRQSYFTAQIVCDKYMPDLPQRSASGGGQAERASKVTNRGNSAFRAMLGLPPVSPGTSSTKNTASIPSVPSPTAKVLVSGASWADTSLACPRDLLDERQEAATPQALELRAALQTKPASELPKVAILPSNKNEKEKFTSRAVPQEGKGSAPLSAAPDVEDEAAECLSEQKEVSGLDPYAGWQMNPDGTWYPVTPEAIAVYQNYARQDSTLSASLTGSHESSTEIRSVDVNTPKALSATAGDFNPADTTGLTADQIRAKGKARNKGQLSSLVSMANEKKENLENKWARSRQGISNASNKYGF
ncbi:hypothetical protein K437DRAFT_112524 [Tilletiaria anomala UBC 951]|uniref:Uncharacterized protein n=1 Tax=Tilletiaria anomala (strain ATCC 24038 / CBS 436.72 / UBC 951) TaxID=1037660 RepID=A0A066W4G1_TILAU|nr:uncharacterized protein K437DRAFT_112524 [Tilletiaria anomala UBC 951]KDN45959.1 hypothetical protein K437DRAFT_112524 [Tilletiaria anomala UBC 951]